MTAKSRATEDPRALARRYFSLLLVLVVPLVVGCHRPSRDSVKRRTIDEMYEKYRRSFPDVPSITVEEFLQVRKRSNPVLVDVRSPEERAVSMIPGAVSREEYERCFDEYAGRDVVIYCTIGYRSGFYAEELFRRGVRCFNLKGGILAWTHAGETVVDEKGETRRVHTYGARWDLLPEDYEAVW